MGALFEFPQTLEEDVTMSRARVCALVLLAALLAMSLSGCSASSPTQSSSSSTATSTASGPAPVVTEKQANTTVQAVVGQPFIVALQGNPTTGFTWKATAVPAFMAQVGDPVFVSQGASGTVGAGGVQTFTFTVKSAGQGPLTMVYARPFEKNVPPAKTFAVTVSSN